MISVYLLLDWPSGDTDLQYVAKGQKLAFPGAAGGCVLPVPAMPLQPFRAAGTHLRSIKTAARRGIKNRQEKRGGFSCLRILMPRRSGRDQWLVITGL